MAFSVNEELVQQTLWALAILVVSGILLVRHVNRQFDRPPEAEQPEIERPPIGLWMMLAGVVVGFLALLKWVSMLKQ